MRRYLVAMCASLLLLATAASAAGVRIIPESFLRGYDPVTIFFASATDLATAGPELHPEIFVRCEPSHPGAYQWVDARTLSFKPATPWPPLSRFRWTVGADVKTLTTMMVPPTTIAPADGARELDPISEITLTFREPVDKLDTMVTFEIRPLPGVDKREPRWLTAADYTIKPVERASAADPASYVFRLNKSIEAGVHVRIHLRLSLDDTAPGSLAEYSFSTRQPFRILAAGCVSGEQAKEPATEEDTTDVEESDEEEAEPTTTSPAAPAGLLPMTIAGTRYTREQAIDGGADAPKIAIQFSAEPEPLSLSTVRALVRFTPALRDLNFTQSGAFLYLTGRVERETVYEAVPQPSATRDRSGRVPPSRAHRRACRARPRG